MTNIVVENSSSQTKPELGIEPKTSLHGGQLHQPLNHIISLHGNPKKAVALGFKIYFYTHIFTTSEIQS
jgi:hypothetical protein